MGCDTIIYFIHFLKYKFQSTHPSWGATKRYPFFKVWCSISIHAPIVGCDSRSIWLWPYINNFNPRTHRGVRLYLFVVLWVCKLISIHAPIVGCDRTGERAFKSCLKFQSTHPSWGATKNAITTVSADKFQSTHPSWGATAKASNHSYVVYISIHAPIVGCDQQDCIRPSLDL